MSEGIKPSVWLPGEGAMEEDEVLQYDPTAYDCMVSMSLGWPSLSFDIISDSLGDQRKEFPHTISMVAGTQGNMAKNNYLAVMRVTNLTQGKHGNAAKGEDSDEDMLSDDDSDEEEDAKFHIRKIAHTGGINRVRCMPQNSCFVASWADTAQVQLWDITSLYQELLSEGDDKTEISSKINKLNALQVHSHSSEGYALDWSPLHTGRLASGDCRSGIHIWEPNGSRWAVGGALKEHEASVEDIQWSPGEATVFASASVDKTVKIWDTRDTVRLHALNQNIIIALKHEMEYRDDCDFFLQKKSMITFKAHDADVNVISWNRLTMYMLASGGDDGNMKVWDLRTLSQSPATPDPVANFSHHKGPITSIEWCPYDASMLSTTSSDDTLGVWDLALERDPEEEAALAESNVAAPENLPAQLLFVHAGQKDMKESHWHRQIPGMIISTALDGFNIFKPANV